MATAVVPQPPVAKGPQVEAEPAPTLADVAKLTHDSDYSRFMLGSVQADVKNAALAKLFTDPHFNVMDGLDVYIDDYGKPDPLPPGMLRQMFQSKVLGLFDDEEDEAKKPNSDDGLLPPPHAAPTDPQEAAEPSAELTAEPTALLTPDENTDLQLQPDDDAGRHGLESGTVENTGRTH